MFVLHVGRHKSGSSSIQHLLSHNAEKLRDYGILYPDVARRDAHHLIAKHLKVGNFSTLDELIAIKKHHPKHAVVMSSEDLGTLPGSCIRGLKDRIGSCDTLVVIYIRDFIGWIPSKYNQNTQVGLNLFDFDQAYGRLLNFRGSFPSYYCEQWANVFGWQNVRVRSLESGLTGGGLIDDFLSIFGISVAELGGPQVVSLERRNVSYGWKVLEVLRAQFAQIARQQGGVPREFAVRICNLLAEILTDLGLAAQMTQYLSARQSEECHKRYRLEIEKLNDVIIGPRLPLPEQPVIQERPFLPTLERIPINERKAIADRMTSILLGKAADRKGPWHRRFARTGIDDGIRHLIIGALTEQRRDMPLLS